MLLEKLLRIKPESCPLTKTCIASPADCTVREGRSPFLRNDSDESIWTLQSNWKIATRISYTQIYLRYKSRQLFDLTLLCTIDNHWSPLWCLAAPRAQRQWFLCPRPPMIGLHWKSPMSSMENLLATFAFAMSELSPTTEWQLLIHQRKRAYITPNFFSSKEHLIEIDSYYMLITYFGSIKDDSFAIWKNTNRPRWEPVLLVIESHICWGLRIIVREKSCTTTGVGREYICLNDCIL